MKIWPGKQERICPICGKPFGSMSWARTKDKKFICASCNKIAKIPIMMGGAPAFTVDEIRERIGDVMQNDVCLNAFEITREVGNYLKVDDHAKRWYLASGANKKLKLVHSFHDVLDIEIIDNGGSKCMELKLKILLRGDGGIEYIDFLGLAEYARNSFTYRTIRKDVTKCEAIFRQMIDYSQQVERRRVAVMARPEATKRDNVADEIRDLAELLEDGYLTQEEFDAKKKELLGL